MSPNDVETTSEAGQAPSEKPAAKKTKAAKDVQKPAPTEAKQQKEATTIDEVMAAIKNMSVLELSQLVKALESEFGIAAAPVVAAAPAVSEAAASAAAPAEVEEEQAEFTVILKDIGPNKINVIKAVRELTSLGLKESKDLVESAPKAVKEGVNKDEAAAMKQKLEAAGATVEVT